MPMLKHILVPLDGSERDDDALYLARSLADHLAADFVLVHIMPATATPAETQANHQHLDALAAILRRDGYSASTRISVGNPPHVLAETAERVDPAVVVLARAHRGAFERLTHPSVTVHLMEHTSAPLLVLPETYDVLPRPDLLHGPGASVFVALDGSAGAERAMPFALELAHFYARPLVLVRVVPPIVMVGNDPQAPSKALELAAVTSAAALDYLTSLRARTGASAEVPVQTLLVCGDPAEELVRLSGSHPGSILVMGSRGQGWLRRTLLGSVAAEVSRRAAVPVVVVPSRDEPQASKARASSDSTAMTP